jgi:uncharacterized membrane protein/protein-disulfide isomerase
MEMSSSLASHQDSVLFDSADSSPTELSRTKLLFALVTVLAVIALGLSSYLAWSTWSSTPVLGCDSTGLVACDHVLSSPWSKWLGLPVSLFGALAYVGILVASWLAAKQDSSLAWTALLTLSLMAAGSAMWFIGLQAIVLGSFCLYCLGVHACGLAIGVLTVLLVRTRDRSDDDGRMRLLLGVADAPTSDAHDALARSSFHPLLATAAAALGLALLMTGQFFFQPPGLVLEEIAAEAPPLEPETSETQVIGAAALSSLKPETAAAETEVADVATFDADAEQPVESTVAPVAETREETVAYVQQEPEPSVQPATSRTKSRRMIAFKGLTEAIDVYQVPVLGSPEAKHLLVEMMDYTCAHCRHFHPNVHAALERYGDQVAFVVQHVPLSRKCNPHVQRDQAVHKYACDYARLALGVWKLAPRKFVEYHDWLMKSEQAPAVFEARQEAMRLVGEAVLLDENLKANSFRSFAGNSDEVRRLNSGLPVLLTEFGVIRGMPKTESEWFQFLEELLDIKPLAVDAD